MKRIILSLIIVINIFALDKVTITSGEWRPWTGKKLKNNGIAIDIVRKIFNSQNIKSEFFFMPWVRAYKLAQNGKYDASAVWFKNKDREKDFLFSDSIFFTQDVIIYKKGKNIVFNNFDDLKKYKIALVRGYSYGKEIDEMVKNKELNVKWVKSDLLALKQLVMRDYFDIFICAKSVAKDIIKKNFKDKSIFKFYPKPTIKNSLYLIVSKKSKYSKEIIKAFNKGLNEFKSKGLIKNIIESSY